MIQLDHHCRDQAALWDHLVQWAQWVLGLRLPYHQWDLWAPHFRASFRWDPLALLARLVPEYQWRHLIPSDQWDPSARLDLWDHCLQLGLWALCTLLRRPVLQVPQVPQVQWVLLLQLVQLAHCRLAPLHPARQ